MAVNVSPDQRDQILTPVDASLQEAMLNGVVSGAQQILAGIMRFNELTPEQQALTRDTFRLIIAAMIKTLNIQAPLPDVLTNGSGFSGSVGYLKQDGSYGYLLFDNGIFVDAA
jgi:hypothetical protein